MSFDKASDKKLKAKFESACRQGYCPSLEERANDGVQGLSNRLKAASDKETLTNVLEWQDKNVVFWFERDRLALAITAAAVVLVITSPFLILNSPVVYGYFEILASMIVTLLAVTVYIIRSYRKLPLSQLINIFPLSVSINTILENKLCVCRDYAKLSACLLSNIFPEKEIYFAHATSHVAAGIMIDKKLYIIDKYLPIVTIDKWHERWHKGEYSEKTIEGLKGTSLESVDLESLLSKTSSAQLDTERLADEMKRLLGIQSSLDETKWESLKVLQWKNGGILYEDDEIVNYSLARRLNMKISSQIMDLKQLTGIEINREQDDLVFQVWFKMKK
jgi:predicted transglutaminase-like protease